MSIYHEEVYSGVTFTSQEAVRARPTNLRQRPPLSTRDRANESGSARFLSSGGPSNTLYGLQGNAIVQTQALSHSYLCL